MPPRRPRARGSLPALAALALTLLAPACRRKHIRVASVPQLGYPRCGDVPLPPGEVLASGHLRAGPTMREHLVVERFEVRRRACLTVATVRQEWPLGVSDVEVVYDAAGVPLRAWRRGTIPGVLRADGNADIRRYEFRTPEVTVTRRGSDGATTYEIIRGGRPRVVIAPGRGLLTVWIRRAHLAVGGRLRELALDLRSELEELREVSLIREDDQYEPSLGRTVRVYTIYGRDAVFADETDLVIGDLAGLRPHAALPSIPEPPPLPTYGVIDPVNTP